MVLLHYWRGPFIAINAGPLTSNEDQYEMVYATDGTVWGWLYAIVELR